jgi:hypothetical protein
MKTLNKAAARAVLKVVDAGLVKGLGEPVPGKMCVEAAICFALNLPHGDQPRCVAAFIRSYKIKINDARWSSNAARTSGMRRAAIAQLGSDFLDLPENRERRKECVRFIVEQTIRRVLPLPLRRAAEKHKDKIHAERMIEAALRCEKEGTRDAAVNARDIGYTAYAAAAAADAAAADAAAADAAAAAAAAAADAAAAAAAADAAAAYAADAAYRDNVLNTAAEICVEACIKFKTSGSKWLDILDEKKAD